MENIQSFDQRIHPEFLSKHLLQPILSTHTGQRFRKKYLSCIFAEPTIAWKPMQSVKTIEHVHRTWIASIGATNL